MFICGGHILLVIWSWFHGRMCLFIVLEMLIRIVQVDQCLVHSWEIVWMCLIDMLETINVRKVCPDASLSNSKYSK